jgi:transposase
MSISNKYVKNAKISEPKFRELLKYFVLDLDAHTIALLTELTGNTVNRYLYLIRKRIADICEEASPFQGEIEVDESYFGSKRIKGKRCRGAGGKTPVFGILQRKGNVCP